MNYNYNENILVNSYNAFSKIKELQIDLDLYRLNAFKNVLSSFSKSNKFWNYYISKEKKIYSRMIIENLENIRWYDCPKLTQNSISDFCVHICFDCKEFNKLNVQTFCIQEKEYKLQNNEIEIINDFFYNKIIELYKNVKKSILVENYFFENYQLKIGDIAGYYHFDRIELDCGEETNNYIFPRVIKCKIKYYKVIINELKNNMIACETIKIDRKIIITLLQTFTRCAFNNQITDGRYFGNHRSNLYEFNKDNEGKFITLDRNKIVTEFYKEVPSDTNLLINKFYELDYNNQNIFLVACEAYIDGLKDNSGKALTSFVIALESLANHKYKNKKLRKKERIYKLITELFKKDTIVSKEFVYYIYNLRCLYSHQAIANNQIKGVIFDVYEIDEKLILKVEALTYSILIKWLLKEVY